MKDRFLPYCSSPDWRRNYCVWPVGYQLSMSETDGIVIMQPYGWLCPQCGGFLYNDEALQGHIISSSSYHSAPDSSNDATSEMTTAMTIVFKITSRPQDVQQDARLSALITYARQLGLEVAGIDGGRIGTDRPSVKRLKHRPGRKKIPLEVKIRVWELDREGKTVPEIKKKVPIHRTSIYAILKEPRPWAPEASSVSLPVEDMENIAGDVQARSFLTSGINGQVSGTLASPEIGDGATHENLEQDDK